MNRTVLAAVTLAVTCLASLPAFAHDQSLHKGKATEGEIVSVEPGHFTMKTEGGQKKITIGGKTRIEVGDSGGSRADLKGGAHVAVFGTKLPGGEIVAKEIVVQEDPAHRHESGHGGQESAPYEAHE